MAVGKKLCECLVFRVFLALPRALLLNRAQRGGKGHPITLSAERITRCSLALSLAAAAGNQVMMAEVTMDSPYRNSPAWMLAA